jgi:hypothetical protein
MAELLLVCCFLMGTVFRPWLTGASSSAILWYQGQLLIQLPATVRSIKNADVGRRRILTRFSAENKKVPRPMPALRNLSVGCNTRTSCTTHFLYTNAMPKSPAAKEARSVQRHNPLADDYSTSKPLKHKPTKRRKRDVEEAREDFVDSRSSQKILQIGRELADEELEQQKSEQAAENPLFGLRSQFEEEEEEEEHDAQQYDDDGWGDDLGEEEDEEVNPQDLEIFNKFHPTSTDPIFGEDGPENVEGQGTNLADLILEKIAAFEAGNGQSMPAEDDMDDRIEIPANVVEAFSKSV